MPRHFSPLQIALIALAALLLVAPRAGGAQNQDAEVARLQAALAANRTNPSLQQCVDSEPAIERYNAAADDLAHVGEPNRASPFNCSGIGASWQVVAPAACCATFDRDKGRNVDAAWTALQACGLRDRIAQRRPAFVVAANKCLAASGVTTPGPAGPQPSTAAQSDAWSGMPSVDQVRGQILGRDAFAVIFGEGLQVVDNTGRRRSLPEFLADRLRRGFTLLDDRAFIQSALASLNLNLDDVLGAMSQGAPDPSRQFAMFGETFVRYFLPNTSLSIPVGRESATPVELRICRVSSEHCSIRGTINGGGDFIRWTPGDVGPQIIRAALPQLAPDLHLELPSGMVTADGEVARVVTDLAANGAAAILVTSGRVQVREGSTRAVQRVAAGEAVLLWPGRGVSAPVRVSGDRVAAASRPRIRGSIVLQPGQEWSGPLRLDGGLLPIEARLLYEKPAGANYVLEIAVNGRAITEPLLNKMSPMRYADGRNYPYRDPSSAKWMLFYSHDYAANNSAAGGGYEVKTDPGQAYRYVWSVATFTGGNPVAEVRFRNVSNPPVPLELRLLQAEGDTRYTSVTPPQAPEPAPARPRGGWGGVLDALREVAKGTPPAMTPPEAAQSPYVAPPVQGQPHLAVYAAERILAHADFDYPVVVQLQDGSGRPMYPTSPTTVTITSSDVNVVRLYGANAPGTTTVTLKPADRTGAGGVSWESVRVTAGSASAIGRATITATATGFPAASITLTTVPTRTPDNRGTPAQTAPAARVNLTVLPPIVETNRRPLIYLDLVDANGQPTGVDFGPGEWTLNSSNPAVFPTYSSSGRTAALNPVGPGQAQLTVTSRRPGVAGSSATLTVVAPGGAPLVTEHAAPAPAAVGTTGRLADFGDPAPSAGRVSNIVTARGVVRGTAVDITDRFTPDINPIHVWFRVSGFGFGTTLLSKWTYLGGQQPLVIGTADVVLEPANDWATFNYELAPGKRWPAGEYLVEILMGNSVVGRTTFEVVR